VDTTMMEQRQHIRYQVEFPALFSGDYDGMGIVYNLGMGGCKVVSDLPVKNGARLTVHLQTPGQPLSITIQAATVQWTLQLEFGVEFLEVQEQERTRLGQFLANQANVVS
jgi:hypothetical protein